MKKAIAMLCILTFSLGVFAGCKKSEKNETAQPTETESAAETETADPLKVPEEKETKAPDFEEEYPEYELPDDLTDMLWLFEDYDDLAPGYATYILSTQSFSGL